MATYIGNFTSFDKFIGPRLRNIIQTSIARKYKKGIGKCQNCESNENLESAHIKGKDRKELMELAFNATCVDGEVDLIKFEEKFKELHLPVEKCFKILCRTCHREYDRVEETFTLENESIILSNKEDIENSLNIFLYPEDITEFKELLLQYKVANIEIKFKDGNSIIKQWNASNFKENSDVVKNLRSRQEFRQGNWQKNNIKEVCVEIVYK